MTFEHVCKFMHRQDPNGDWLNAETSESAYILETLQAWLSDGLQTSAQVTQIIEYMKEMN